MAVAKNDITHDALISRGNTKEYEENYDKIFQPNYGKVVDTVTGKEYNKCCRRCWLEVADGVKTCTKKGCNIGEYYD